jgi:hypothetical protein
VTNFIYSLLGESKNVSALNKEQCYVPAYKYERTTGLPHQDLQHDIETT